MSDLKTFQSILSLNQSLGVCVTSDGESFEPQVSVVNVAIVEHLLTADSVVAIVARPGAKLRNLRKHARATIVARAGWEWTAVSGPVELSGPDDPGIGLTDSQQAALLRDIYHAAGGTHDDLAAYDLEMLSDRRCAVLLKPERCWSNPSGSEHVEFSESGESA